MELKIVEKPPVDIEFCNLSYSTGKKKILKAVSGKFSSGRLTGILGSSGAGKTTLLNVLAGQLQGGVSGNIYINGEPRIIKKFHKISSYIMQEDIVQPYLTVMESIRIAANLKLGKQFSEVDKESLILGILSVIGLDASADTRVENLSGGQRKRLIIALELVNNPSVVFLDEPTTGLDDVAMRNCMHLLKSLTLRGRTIICTLHQPSDTIFKLFDTVYFMSDGFCVYHGTVPDLVPFLSRVGFSCPRSYNPADYIIEVVHDDERNTLTLRDMVERYEANVNQEPKVKALVETAKPKGSLCDDQNLIEFSTSFWTQLSVLLSRNFLQMRRNRIALGMQFQINIICGLVFGWLFHQIGTKGSDTILNLKCFYGMVIFHMFTHLMSPILLYPLEVKLLEREYFNRWYSLKAYFAALTIGLLPISIMTTCTFAVLSYTLTGQPLEWYRFGWFYLISILMVVASQGMGYTIGTIFNSTRGACVGSAVSIPLIVVGMQGAGYGDNLHPFIRYLMSLSYPYHAYAGLSSAIFKDRGILDCGDIFCHFADTDFLLLKMGMAEINYSHEALFLLVFTILHKILSYLILRIRVSPDCMLLRNVKLFDLT